MALHRDIYWVGRQWAVTGHGIQACDQKRRSEFDIEIARLWDDGVLERMRDLSWLDRVDFEKAIAAARKYYPEPAPKPPPTEERVLGLIAEVLREPGQKGASEGSAAVEEPKPAAQEFKMLAALWPAKFVPQWRIRIKQR
jgi:hypothetical protein